MIKFVLAFIAIILVTLGIYTYTNQNGEKTVSTSSSVAEKVEVEETEKVLPQTHEVKAKKSSAKYTTVKSPKVVSSETSNEMADEEEMITKEDLQLELERLNQKGSLSQIEQRRLEELTLYMQEDLVNNSESTSISKEENLIYLKSNLKTH